jgi:glycosyltransferase involved in cell wall biosynthesis
MENLKNIKKTNSLIIPVYNNEESIHSLLYQINKINKSLKGDLEILFAIDGSLDRSYEILKSNLSQEKFSSKIIVLSRNFGSLNAIRAALEIAKGDYFATMSADLQEPPELIINFFKTLKKQPVDVVIGVRESREDPVISKAVSVIFWYIYKKFILKEVPSSGIDVFGCNKIFRDNLIKLKETRSSLIFQIFWIGFRRKEILYKRLKNKFGKSQWSFKKKLEYMLDSMFSFSELPIKLIICIGFVGIFFFTITGIVTIIGKYMGLINVPGYTTTLLTIGLLSSINLFCLGLIGSYVFRIYENSKGRPLSIVLKIDEFEQ